MVRFAIMLKMNLVMFAIINESAFLAYQFSFDVDSSLATTIHFN